MACSGPIPQKTEYGNVFRACGQCLNCRIKNQSSLTLRCLLENTQAQSGFFGTFTYREAPEVGDYKDFQMFLDRLRAHSRRNSNFGPIRYLAVGEYGDLFGRFHFHALLWNVPTIDPEVWDTRLWPHGFTVLGEINPASVRYTTRYTTKFLDKGEDALPRGRSQKPPLGEMPMRSLAREALAQGHKLPEPPSMIRWNGKSWPVDLAMQIAWAEEANPEMIKVNAGGTRTLARSRVDMIRQHTEVLKFGDPSLAYRLDQERRFLRRQKEMENRLKL